jgi:hypothetical protein
VLVIHLVPRVVVILVYVLLFGVPHCVWLLFSLLVFLRTGLLDLCWLLIRLDILFENILLILISFNFGLILQRFATFVLLLQSQFVKLKATQVSSNWQIQESIS